MTNEQPGVEVLEANVCWMLLRSAGVGRLAVLVDGRPDIFPVNYVVDRGTLVFRTATGTKHSAVAASSRVAFEVDGYDPDAGEAWSVVVKGEAEQSTTIPDTLDTMELPLFPWHAGPKHRFIRIVPAEISGRRFHVLDSAAWRLPLAGAPHAPPE